MSFPARQPARSEFTAPDEIEIYNDIIERARKFGNADPEKEAGLYGHLLLSPQIAISLRQLAQFMKMRGDHPGSYSHSDREWVDIVLAVELKSNRFLPVHLPDAVNVGVRPDAIEAMLTGKEDDLTEDEAFLTSFIRKVVKVAMDADTWAKMEQRLGERGTLEYATFVLYLQFVMALDPMLRTKPAPTNAEILELLGRIRAGEFAKKSATEARISA